MSTYENDVLAESLFERLESLEISLGREYEKNQKHLLGLLARGQFEEAQWRE